MTMTVSLTPSDNAMPLAPPTNHRPPKASPAMPNRMSRTDFHKAGREPVSAACAVSVRPLAAVRKE